jgi:hypothetical protein
VERGSLIGGATEGVDGRFRQGLPVCSEVAGTIGNMAGARMAQMILNILNGIQRNLFAVMDFR